MPKYSLYSTEIRETYPVFYTLNSSYSLYERPLFAKYQSISKIKVNLCSTLTYLTCNNNQNPCFHPPIIQRTTIHFPGNFPNFHLTTLGSSSNTLGRFAPTFLFFRLTTQGSPSNMSPQSSPNVKTQTPLNRPHFTNPARPPPLRHPSI